MSEPTIPICQHIKTNGSRCQVQAMQNRTFCHLHDETEKRRRTSARVSRRLADRNRRTINIPVLEDANAVQVALQETIYAFLDKRLDQKDASILLYALQTATSNVKSLNLTESAPHWSIREELSARRDKIYEEINNFNKWEKREREITREKLEKEFQAKLAELKKPPASEAPLASPATQ